MTIDKNTLAAIKLKYTGRELEVMLKAWDNFPTLKNHCKLDKQRQEGKRMAYFEREMQVQKSET